jgi:A/G-specific adenine glycosylase
MHFYNSLLSWYLQHKRDLPWRNTTDPYPIWLSEIMLQQTRVAQGLPYFMSFMDAFPTVFDLAKADEEQVLKLWQGLGYYSRARNMHQTAKIIAHDFNGIFPNNYHDLLQLKGIGQYTAAAIASLAFNEAVPVVDGNVFRVLARYLNVETDIGSAAAKKEFTALAQELMPNDNPAQFNQAIMEFGALQCVPKNPNCSQCVLNSSCAALQKGTVSLLPIKLKKTKVTNRYINYIVLLDPAHHTLINKRTEKGIWHNLYEFPCIETETEMDFASVNHLILEQFQDYNIESVVPFNPSTIIHKLSHLKLHINFFSVGVNQEIPNGITTEEIKKYPFPIVIYNFIEKYSI